MSQDSRLRTVMYWLIASQYVWAIIIAVVPFGFDHPSSLGLDFKHRIVALLILAGLSIAAIALTAKLKDPMGLLFAVLPLFIWLLLIFG